MALNIEQTLQNDVQLYQEFKPPVPAKVKSKSGAFYVVDLYENGIDSAATQTNIPIYVLEINFSNTIPAGTWIMANYSYMGVTGGG